MQKELSCQQRKKHYLTNNAKTANQQWKNIYLTYNAKTAI